jgi:hypothetical protein
LTHINALATGVLQSASGMEKRHVVDQSLFGCLLADALDYGDGDDLRDHFLCNDVFRHGARP